MTMDSIHWNNFNPTTLQEARRADRPIFLVITASWCTHCKELMATTMRDPRVVAAVNDGFLPVQVDADRRPDINNRYGTGSWPTVAWLTPQAELITNEGFLSAEELTLALAKVSEMYREQGGEIERSLKELWNRKAESGERPREGRLREEMVEDIVDAIYEKFDHRYGGWGDGAKFPHPEALDFAMVQVAKRGDDRMREVVTLTLDRMMEGGIHDVTDGGFFRFSRTPDWRSPNHEKMLGENAMRLRCYLEGFQLFENPGYRRAAEGIVEWMHSFLRDGDTGAFFGSQDADPDYYVLDREGRGLREPPRVDRTVFTNWNAATVSSLLKASVVLDRPDLRDSAITTLDFLVENVYRKDEALYHYWDGTYHLPGLLSDQAYMIRALVDGTQHTGNSDYLLTAEAIAEQSIEKQRAPDGGFYDILHEPGQQGTMRRRNRSILENAVMAEALIRLSYLSRRPEFYDEAIQTLEAFTSDYKEYGYYVAGYGRAVDLVFYQPLFLTIVGKRDSEAADALRRAALAQYVPSRMVQMLDPDHDPVLLSRGNYKVEDEPVAYVSVGREERAIVRDPDELQRTIAEVERSRR